MSLTGNFKKWEELSLQLQQVEMAIIDEVLLLGKSQSYGNVEAKFRKSSSNGKYDYEGMTRELEPDMELVQQCTVYPEPYVDFKKLAEMAGATEEIKAKHYIPPSDSKPTVTVQFKK